MHLLQFIFYNFRLSSGHPAKPARTLQEMESEAELLRNELKRMTVQA